MEAKHPHNDSSEPAAKDEKNYEVEWGVEYEAQVVKACHTQKPGAWLVGGTASAMIHYV